MTSQPKTATLSEHADSIKAAIKAAIDDGYHLEIDVDTVYYNGRVERIEVDLFDGADYINLLTEDRT
jgi:hypothetical protein